MIIERTPTHGRRILIHGPGGYGRFKHCFSGRNDIMNLLHIILNRLIIRRLNHRSVRTLAPNVTLLNYVTNSLPTLPSCRLEM
jgi:hypothetical protein